MTANSLDPLLPTSRAGALLWGAAGVSAFVAVVTAPVATFLVLIVGFGLLHVLTELRYVDARFSRRFERRWLLLALSLVGAIAVIRVLLTFQALPYEWGVGLETAVGTALAILGATLVRRYRIAVAAGIAAFAAIAFVSPLHALLTVAILHNLTPLGFFAERLPQPDRRIVLLTLSIPFAAVPLFIATGLPLQAMSAIAGTSPDWTPFALGPATRHMGAFLPPEMTDGRYAFSAFAGAVFAQSMHYLAVIVVLPRLQPESAHTLVSWPRGSTFWLTTGAACLALIALYVSDYGQAKALYGLFAAIHGWIEIPILIAALSVSDEPQP